MASLRSFSTLFNFSNSQLPISFPSHTLPVSLVIFPLYFRWLQPQPGQWPILFHLMLLRKVPLGKSQSKGKKKTTTWGKPGRNSKKGHRRKVLLIEKNGTRICSGEKMGEITGKTTLNLEKIGKTIAVLDDCMKIQPSETNHNKK